MCGIFLYISPKKSFHLKKIFNDFYKLKHRGPDNTQVQILNLTNDLMCFIGFHRLSITGKNGMQPFRNKEENIYTLCNGEIYNYKHLISSFELKPETDSDCEVLLKLYEKKDLQTTIKLLLGEFAFVILDTKTGKVHYGRDMFGVRPLFVYNDIENRILILSSEAKAIDLSHEDDYDVDMSTYEFLSRYNSNLQKQIEKRETISYFKLHQVSPRAIHTYDYINSSSSFNFYTSIPEEVENVPLDRETINNYLTQAVIDRIKTDSSLGFLLSGGLDSSLILSIAIRYYHWTKALHKFPVKVFTFGFTSEAPDVLAAKKVVEYLKNMYGEGCIEHHVVILPIKKGLDAIPRVIKTLESYDTTTVRASTPMFLLCEYIKNFTDIKVLLSGEGSDELFGGYLYFHYAPTREEFCIESRRLLQDIHFFDGLRADRCVSAHGLELRVPFLDTSFVKYICSSTNRSRIIETKEQEKITLRNAFKDEYLPNDILYAQKNAFSDAVGYSWKDTLKTHAVMFHSENAKDRSPEENWYFSIFSKIYSNREHLIPYLWVPKFVDMKGSREPSATVLNVHNSKSLTSKSLH